MITRLDVKKDSYIKEFINNIGDLDIEKDPKKLKLIGAKGFNREVENRYDFYLDAAMKNDKSKISNHYIANARISGGTSLSLDLLKKLFSSIKDSRYLISLGRLTISMDFKNPFVNTILINSRRINDIKNIVDDQYSHTEQLNRGCFCKLWTAEIYPCNKLDDNQIILGYVDVETNKGFFCNIIMTTKKIS